MRTTLEDKASRRASRRQIGPIGTVVRIAVGAGAVAVPIALAGFSLWEAVVALVALPLITVVAAPLITALCGRLAPGALEARHPICTVPACSLIVLMVAGQRRAPRADLGQRQRDDLGLARRLDAARRGTRLRRVRGARGPEPVHPTQRRDRLPALYADRPRRGYAVAGGMPSA